MTSAQAQHMSVVAIESNPAPGDFERDVAPLRPELLRTAMRLTGNRFDAEDLVQDALLRAYRSYSTFTAGTNVRAWLHRILKNTWINNYRAAQRRPTEIPTEELTDHLTDGDWSAYRSESAEAAWLAGQPAAELQTAMAELSEDFRLVVYLADIEGHPYAVIADMMATPLGTVMSRIHRARRQLRTELGGTARRRRLVRAA